MTITPAILTYLEGKPSDWAGRYLVTALQAEREGHAPPERHRMALESAEAASEGLGVPDPALGTSEASEALTRPTGATLRNIHAAWESYLDLLQDSGKLPEGKPLPELTNLRTADIRAAYRFWYIQGEPDPHRCVIEQIRGAFAGEAEGKFKAWHYSIEWILGGGKVKVRRAKGLRMLGQAVEVFK